jgi:phenylacetate-CoA ligase
MATDKTAVRFGWSDELVGNRVAWYPAEEGIRVQPQSADMWSAVERLPRERLREIQLRRLTGLLHYVEAASAFYARRWRAAGVSARDVRSLEDLSAFPIVTKEDIDRDQREHPPYGTLPTVAPNRQMKLWQTSGTSATPRLWAETKEDWENGIFLYSRSLYGHGIRPGWRGFLAFGYPPFIGFWLAHYAAEAMGCQVVPRGTLPTSAWLSLMQRLAGSEPGFLCATPTYAQRQIDAAAESGIELGELRIRVLTLAGEPGACIPGTKTTLQTAWGAVVHDIMGATETSGPLLFTCEAQAAQERPSDHANVDYFLLEVLDPATHAPVSDGEAGSLCVTALARTGMPAVRFLLDDRIQVSWDQCACGRTLPLIKGGIRTRYDDMLVISGVNLYPALIEDVVHSTEGLGSEFLIVRGDGRPTVRVEARPEIMPSAYETLRRQVQDGIRAATTLTVAVDVVGAGSLPRSQTKSRRLA